MSSLVVALLFACAKTSPSTPSAPTVLHFAAINDFHGGLYEKPVPGSDAVAGGLPWLAGALDVLRAEHPDLVVLDGGDLFQGAWAVNQSRGMGSVRAFERLGVDAAAIGNHEFDYGGGANRREALEQAAAEADFHWLSANIRLGDAPWQPPGVAPWTLVRRGEVDIGIIGLTTMDTPTTTRAEHVADLTFADPVAVVSALVPEVRAAGADVVVVVGHLTGGCAGGPPDFATPPAPCLPDGEIGRLLTELPPGTVDVIVAGHAHTLMAHRWMDTFLLENRAEGSIIGQLDLVVGPDGVDRDASVVHPPWALVHPPTDPRCGPGEYDLTPREIGGRRVTPSADALALVRSLEAESGSLCAEVGCASVPLGRSREAESGAGDLLADAMRSAFPNADLAVQNSGGVRADIPAGPLRREHLQAVMPFDNRLLLVEMTGAQLRTLFRIGSSGAHGLLQVSGAAYAFDPARTGGSPLDAEPAHATWETDRLCRVTVGGAPLDDQRVYRVATTDFLLGGGDHLGPAFVGARTVAEGPLLRDALFAHVEAQTSCLPAAPAADAPRVVVGPCAP